MSWIENIRQQFGLSQTELAYYLGLSRSRIAQAENNSKPLTTASVLLLNKLMQWGSRPVGTAVQQKAAQLETAVANKAKAKHKRRLKQCMVLLDGVQNQLSDAETKYQQALQSLQWIEEERAEGTTQTALLNVLEKKAFDMIKRNGSVEQAQLQLRMAQLQVEIDGLSQMVV